MRIRIALLSLAVLCILGGTVKAEAATGQQAYTGRVVASTYAYRPCVTLRHTREGRASYWDMVMDNTDDGRKRSVSSQVRYVRSGCVAITRGH